MAEVCADEQVAARKMIVDLVHPIAGRQTMPNSPFKFSQTPVRLQDPAPTLGQHTEDMLTSLPGSECRRDSRTTGRGRPLKTVFYGAFCLPNRVCGPEQ